MTKLLTAIILVAISATAQAQNKRAVETAEYQANRIHPDIKVQMIENSTECKEIAQNLKGAKVYYYDNESRASFNGVLNSKGQYVYLNCNGKHGNYALIASKSLMDRLMSEKTTKDNQQAQQLRNKAKDSGLL